VVLPLGLEMGKSTPTGIRMPVFPVRSLVAVRTKPHPQRLRWSRGSVLASGTQVRGFAHGRSLRIFKAKNILSTPSFGGEVKPSVPCRSFTACKRSLYVTWKSAFRQKFPGYFSLTVPPSAVGCSRLVTRVETPGGESWNI